MTSIGSRYTLLVNEKSKTSYVCIVKVCECVK